MNNIFAIISECDISEYNIIIMVGGVVVRIRSGRTLTYSVESLPGGNFQRLKEMILYISEKCKDNDTYGATKLNKILFHSDFRSFERRGKPITGEVYQRLPMGPAPLRMCIANGEMETNKEIEIMPCTYHDKKQRRTIPQRKANLDFFDVVDISIVDEVIKELWEENATEVSRGSHGIAWRLCNDGDRIPYEAALLSESNITDDHVKRAIELAEKFGW